LPLFFFPCSVDDVEAAETLAVFDEDDVPVFDADGTTTGMAGRFRGIEPVIKLLSFDAGAEPVEAVEEDEDFLGMGAAMVDDDGRDDVAAGVDFLSEILTSVAGAVGFDVAVDCFFAADAVASAAVDDVVITGSDFTANGCGSVAFCRLSCFGCVDCDFMTAASTFLSWIVPFAFDTPSPDADAPALARSRSSKTAGGRSNRLTLSNAATLPSPVATTLPQLVENQR